MAARDVIAAGLLLEAVARKIRRHKGEFTELEMQVVRLHVQTALDKLPQPAQAAAGNGARRRSHTTIAEVPAKSHPA
jgi:hypothetical protein